MLAGEILDFDEIDAVILRADPVSDGIEPFARQIWPRSMRQMSARSERHSEDGVTRLEQRDKHGLIGLRAGMRLHIGKAAPEQPLGALDRERLGYIDKFASAVISPTRIAFGVFVRQHRALGFQHRPGDDVLAGDKLDLGLLAFLFSINRRSYLRISLEQCVTEKIVDNACVNRRMD